MVTKREFNSLLFPLKKKSLSLRPLGFSVPHWTRMHVNLLGPCFKTGRARAPLDPTLFFRLSFCPAHQKGSNITLSTQRTPITVGTSPIVMWSLWTERELKPHWFPMSYNKRKAFVPNLQASRSIQNWSNRNRAPFRGKKPPICSLMGGKKSY